jgi:hypothetical protein
MTAKTWTVVEWLGYEPKRHFRFGVLVTPEDPRLYEESGVRPLFIVKSQPHAGVIAEVLNKAGKSLRILDWESDTD